MNKNSKSKKDNDNTVEAVNNNAQSKIVWKSHGEFFNAVRNASLTNQIDPRLVIKEKQ